VRRKSCECNLCGGQAKRIPIAALEEEVEELNDSILDEQRKITKKS
jgi:hypothetical protein